MPIEKESVKNNSFATRCKIICTITLHTLERHVLQTKTDALSTS